MFSIDQNSHSLWDTLPKLQAIAAAGHGVSHFIEDIDVAFTDLGADVADGDLRIQREQFHPSGGSAWGAALFYTDFLGRQPTELRDYEDQLGMKVSSLAKQIDTPLEDLYSEFSVSDNHMLVGSSYAGDRQHHRLIGDLGIDEVRPFIEKVLDLGRQDCLRRFPDADSQTRTREWFDREAQRINYLLDATDTKTTLTDFYNRWLEEYLRGEVSLRRASELFALDGDPQRRAVLEIFLRDYDQAAGLYNQAMKDADVGVHPLHTDRGELPFFAVFRHDGHLVRTGATLDNNTLLIDEWEFPVADGRLPGEAMADAGITAVAGKAALLVIQARLGENRRRLALPYHGSLYMPAAYRLEELLDETGLLPGPVEPVCRVRLHLLDRLADVSATIALPEYLARELGCDEIPASRLAAEYDEIQTAAATRLEQFRNEDAREAWLDETFASERSQIEEFEQQKRDIARQNPKDPKVRELWKQERGIRDRLTVELLRRVHADIQLSQLDFYDSRGAILPWCVALGGEALYNDVIHKAELYDETPRNYAP
jgi:hypothetical protein